MPPSPLHNNGRDSNAVRASIFDVCLQLGALDDNSVIADWIFNDPSADPSTYHRRPTRRYQTRFQEVLTPVEESTGVDEEEERKHRRFPFSLFTPRSRSRSRHGGNRKQTGAADGNVTENEDNETDRTRSSPSTPEKGGSFFRRRTRTPHKSDATDRSQPNSRTTVRASSRYDSGYASIRSKPLRRGELGDSDGDVPTSRSTPEHASLTDGDGDEEWEAIEALPDSPLYPLPNKGINPMSVYSTPDPDSRRNTNYSALPSLPRLPFRSTTPVPVPPSSPSPGDPHRKGASKLTKSPPASPSPYQTKNPKHLSIRTGSPAPSPVPTPARPGHAHTRSVSMPSSPHIPFPTGSPNTPVQFANVKGTTGNSPNGLRQSPATCSPSQASHIVSTDNAAVLPRASMGYHNQFFARPAAQSLGSDGNPPGRPLAKEKEKEKGRFFGMKKG